MEKGRDLRPVQRRHRDLSGDSQEIRSHDGVDVESTSSNARPLTEVVTGGAILLVAALLVLFTDLWRLVFSFCWVVPLALVHLQTG